MPMKNLQYNFAGRYETKKITLTDIDLTDTTYRITTQADHGDLVRSITDVGLLNPPILTIKKPSFVVVSGFRRIHACEDLGWNEISVRILNSDTTHHECTKIAIADNSFQRSLNLVEQSRAIGMLIDIFGDINSVTKINSSLGLPDNPSLTDKILSIRSLPLFIQKSILDDTISLAIALELGKFEQKTADLFLTIFQQLKLSFSKQKEIILLANEVALRDNVPLICILEDEYMRNVLDDKEIDRNKRSDKIRNYLKRKRFPEITRAENKFARNLKNLRLGTGAKLTPPKNFEGINYSLTFNFSSLKELKDRKAILEHLISNPGIRKILER